MDVFIGQLVGFLLIIALLWKFVVPFLRKTVKSAQDVVDQQVAESDAAKARLEDAKVAHERSIEQAKVEAKQLHEGAIEDAKGIADDLHKQADVEVKRISEHGKAQGELIRTSMVRQLRSELGLTAVDGAGKIVRDHLADPANQSETVDRVIDELAAMSRGGQPSTGVPSSSELIGLHSMHAASRDAARAVAREFSSNTEGKSPQELLAASEDLTQIIDFLQHNPVLRKKFTEDEDFPALKKQLVHSLFDGKASPIAVEVVASAVAQHWSQPNDILVALRRQNALVVLTAAERDGQIEQVEDELFRVSRLLEANPTLASLLTDFTKPADRRNALLTGLLGSQIGNYTAHLLTQTISLLNGQPAESAVDQLAQLAAAMRGETVAHVVSAAELSDAQKQRLGGVLAEIYHRKISVQTEIDPSIIGGLRIGVGDEVIEADIATRLAKAAETLPR
ncbi:F0F1 ATP synthase subunit B/delta [Gordonia sputi]|uniref:ATP synthase subunit delta n=1 Tax=Gordonia sputi NBRC 100414 TaxID=1089453 RepID=H5U0A0_9ACTN|nr:F0F1 ATP synthase subunit B/delta [Gordonia sputi]NKY95359.1 F0F1 ATP synthase subunit B/delta [Gordonia sputi]GAB39158.1 ATP synthase subunit b/ATP synthase subunit delta [Gordonia sputi NBRC 100414]